jgi:hypothetical protein
MPRDETLILSLTGPDSHRMALSPGLGVVVIGPPRRSPPRPDLVVAVDDAIDWAVFDPFTTPGGSLWPRRIIYEGDDTGFFRWALDRPNETFNWEPHAAHVVDAAAARISHLGITLRRAPLHLAVPSVPHGSLSVRGDLSLFTAALADGAACPTLAFAPDTRPAPHAPPLRLPDLPALAGAHAVTVAVRPLRQAFDCASLLQFPGIRRLVLTGQLANLDALAQLRHLDSLRLADCPDLAGLPALDTWPALTELFVSNVDDTTGRRLRAELRRGDRQWRHSSITQLRRPGWFATEYGLPFSGWPARTAKTATAAYRAAEQAIAAAAAPAGVEAAVRAFVGAVNALPGIETAEREDTAEAVFQLAAAAPCGDLSDAAIRWFDDARDF